MKCDKSKSMLTTTKIMSYGQQGNLPNSTSAVEEPADWATISLGAEVAKLPEVEEVERSSGSSEKINQKRF